MHSIPAYWQPAIDLLTSRMGDHRTAEGLKFLTERSPLTHVERISKQVYVEGRLSSHTYQTQSRETRHSNDINITDVQFLGQRSDRLEDVVVAPEEYQEAEADLPF